jgi:hypothetical protein
MNQVCREIDSVLSQESIKTITNKIGVGTSEIFLKIGWHKSKAVFIDITLADGATKKHDSNETLKEGEVFSSQVKFARASIEVICRQASLLLQNNVSTLEQIATVWAGTSIYHGGMSPQLECVCSSPLDAASRMIKNSLTEWEERFKIG